MGKMRVYEVAKDLGVESKNLIQVLEQMGIEVKNHMSTLEDKAIEDVSKKLKGQAKGGNERNGTNQQKTDHISHGQVTQNRQGNQEQRPQGNQGQRPQGNQGQRPQGYQGQRPQGNQGQRPQGNQGQRPQGNQGQRPQGNQGQRPQGNQGQRPQGYQGQRPQGYQGQRPQGSQGQRPQGNQGQRPQGYQGQRPQGGQGQRPQGGNQGQRFQGNQGQRPQGNQGQRFQDNQGQRPQGNQGQRFQDNKKPNTAAGTPIQKAPGKRFGPKDPRDNRDARFDNRDNRDNKKNNSNYRGRKPRNKQPEVTALPPKELKPIVMGESIAVQDLAEKMSKKAAELIKKLMGLGIMATINQEIDADTATLIAGEFGYEVQVQTDEDIEENLIAEPEESEGDLEYRPCVVTVMGHVDHGKTSLLDAIRSANVIATEAGGITQHIGAYQVEHEGKKITFLDTPGHEAFTAMRARGAQVTDIAILVVAADDGVMPQTIEAINHAKAANVPIIVAINKMDKPDANPDRVKQEMTEHGLVPEEWGGDTICVNVSAKAHQNIEDLLEMIILVADVQDLKANPNRRAKGTVVEAELDKGRGPVATVLVQTGTLNIGDAIIAGYAFGRVRAMIDDKGRKVKSAGPSTPVEVLGLAEVPQAGDVFYAVEDERVARQIAGKRLDKKRAEEQKQSAKVSLDDLFKQIKEGQVKDLNVIIKGDVQGSVEAIKQSLVKLSTDEVRVKPIHGGVGAITETDIMLASASNAIILGFNVRPDANARRAAEAEQVDMRLYRVIYNAIEDVKAAMEGMLEPDLKEVTYGRAEVRQLFKVSKVGTIAGCYVTEGKMVRDAELRVIRDGIVVFEGKMDSLKRFKDDAKEVAQGFECGITLERFNDLSIGDTLEAFGFEEVKREL